jgi:hypothetical protein
MSHLKMNEMAHGRFKWVLALVLLQGRQACWICDWGGVGWWGD